MAGGTRLADVHGAVTPGERRAIHAATHPAYRPDIDGLRALAVSPVVLFHAGVRGFSGGFVGVDIFFVISGYLITGILVRDVALGRHSIAEFYRRRILRIFPALMVVIAATTVAAWVTLLPQEVERYAVSLAATALFGSNFAFRATTDYFNQGALIEPLLHTWSLAVEEQWYIFWPLVIAAIGPRRPRLMLGVTAAVTILSLALAIWLLPRDQATTFYLLPTRAWELGLGALIAIAGPRALPRWLAEAAGVIGILLILASIKMLTDTTPFPGAAAVPPCLGAALLIASGGQGTLAARALSLRPLQWIGWISYSLYLWHWPVIIFTENGLFLPRDAATIAGMVIVSVALAWASWRFVERPFRQGVGGWRTSRVLAGGAAAIAGALLLAAVTPMAADALARFTPAETRVASAIRFDGDGAYRRNLCFRVGELGRYDAARCMATRPGKPALLVVGDSHAAQLWPGLSRYRNRYDVLQATSTGCVAKIFPRPYRSYCEPVIDGALVDWLGTHRPAALILASRWQWRWLDGLEETLRDPHVRAAHPILIGPVPTYSAALPRLLVFADKRGDPGLVARALEPEPFAVDRAMRAMAARTGTPYISMIDLLCRGRTCRTYAAPGVPLQFDFGHLTREGSERVVDAIMPRIEAAAAR